MAIVSGLRIPGSLLCGASRAPRTPLGGRLSERRIVHRDVLLWQLRGGPAAPGPVRTARAGSRR